MPSRHPIVDFTAKVVFATALALDAFGVMSRENIVASQREKDFYKFVGLDELDGLAPTIVRGIFVSTGQPRAPFYVLGDGVGGARACSGIAFANEGLTQSLLSFEISKNKFCPSSKER
ncbi:hypothetical protein FB451DRAFT_1174964 [Mycena latifolia]|nr:hypothetical protein FB451DRAFT_1174964 [Mycena latifolia]